MLVLIKNTVSREEEPEFDDVTEIVGVVYSKEDGVELITSDFILEFDEEPDEECQYELDWSRFDLKGTVQISIKKEFGDNSLWESGYILKSVS